jgi:hypothetical protein
VRAISVTTAGLPDPAIFAVKEVDVLGGCRERGRSAEPV